VQGDAKPVTIDETRVVAIDRAYYHISDRRYEIWKQNLRDDPVLGVSEDGVNYEYLLDSVSVRYMLYTDRDGICLTIVGIRPVEAVSSIRSVLKRLGRLVEVVDTIKVVIDVLKGGS